MPVSSCNAHKNSAQPTQTQTLVLSDLCKFCSAQSFRVARRVHLLLQVYVLRVKLLHCQLAGVGLLKLHQSFTFTQHRHNSLAKLPSIKDQRQTNRLSVLASPTEDLYWRNAKIWTEGSARLDQKDRERLQMTMDGTDNILLYYVAVLVSSKSWQQNLLHNSQSIKAVYSTMRMT